MEWLQLDNMSPDWSEKVLVSNIELRRYTQRWLQTSYKQQTLFWTQTTKNSTSATVAGWGKLVKCTMWRQNAKGEMHRVKQRTCRAPSMSNRLIGWRSSRESTEAHESWTAASRWANSTDGFMLGTWLPRDDRVVGLLTACHRENNPRNISYTWMSNCVHTSYITAEYISS